MKLLGSEAVSLPIYVEYATENRTFARWWRFDTANRVPHALYAGTNLLWGPVTVSAEWKDYAQFLLGTNDPPSLIREQPATLLNRATHLLDAQGEEGYQLEVSYAPTAWGSATLNRSRGDGRSGDRFDETYLEMHAAPDAGSRWEGTLFYARGVDSVTSITRRDTYGTFATVRVRERYAATLDAERQTARRVGFTDRTFSMIGLTRFENVLVSLTGSLADRGSIGVTWERTTDQLDLSSQFGRTRPLHLMGWTLNARLAERNEATLFVGKRRGGLACTAGTCYEVQPFEGAELRMTTRF